MLHGADMGSWCPVAKGGDLAALTADRGSAASFHGGVRGISIGLQKSLRHHRTVQSRSRAAAGAGFEILVRGRVKLVVGRRRQRKSNAVDAHR